jgi:hypothetical protein
MIRKLYTIKNISSGPLSNQQTKSELGDPAIIPTESDKRLSDLWNKLDQVRWQQAKTSLAHINALQTADIKNIMSSVLNRRKLE